MRNQYTTENIVQLSTSSSSDNDKKAVVMEKKSFLPLMKEQPKTKKRTPVKQVKVINNNKNSSSKEDADLSVYEKRERIIVNKIFASFNCGENISYDIRKDILASIIGCKIEDYYWYLLSKMRPGMEFENFGKYWGMDFILPIYGKNNSRKYHPLNEEEEKKRFYYENHQPLWDEEIVHKFGSYHQREVVFSISSTDRNDVYNPLKGRKIMLYVSRHPIIAIHNSLKSLYSQKGRMYYSNNGIMVANNALGIQHTYENIETYHMLSYEFKKFKFNQIYNSIAKLHGKYNDFTSEHRKLEIEVELIKESVESCKARVKTIKENNNGKEKDVLENIIKIKEEAIARGEKRLEIDETKIRFMNSHINKFVLPKCFSGMECGHYVIPVDIKRCLNCKNVLNVLKTIVYDKINKYIKNSVASLKDEKKTRSRFWWIDVLGCSLKDYHRYLTTKFQYGMHWSDYDARSKRLWEITFIQKIPQQLIAQRKHLDSLPPSATRHKTNHQLNMKLAPYFHYTNTAPTFFKKVKREHKVHIPTFRTFYKECFDNPDAQIRQDYLDKFRASSLSCLYYTYREINPKPPNLLSKGSLDRKFFPTENTIIERQIDDQSIRHSFSQKCVSKEGNTRTAVDYMRALGEKHEDCQKNTSTSSSSAVSRKQSSVIKPERQITVYNEAPFGSGDPFDCSKRFIKIYKKHILQSEVFR